MELIAQRNCGECSVCCVSLNIDTKELQKLPGVPCTHLCASGGCAIHATRYPVCHVYYCGWRYLGSLDEDWRPDKSGVLFDFQFEGLPDHYPRRPGIRVTIVDKQKALRRAFFDVVAGFIASEVPVVLAVTGPPGHFPARAFLNDALKEAVLNHSLLQVQSVFAQALKGLEAHNFTRVVQRNGGNNSISAAPSTQEQK